MQGTNVDGNKLLVAGAAVCLPLGQLGEGDFVLLHGLVAVEGGVCGSALGEGAVVGKVGGGRADLVKLLCGVLEEGAEAVDALEGLGLDVLEPALEGLELAVEEGDLLLDAGDLGREVAGVLGALAHVHDELVGGHEVEEPQHAAVRVGDGAQRWGLVEHEGAEHGRQLHLGHHVEVARELAGERVERLELVGDGRPEPRKDGGERRHARCQRRAGHAHGRAHVVELLQAHGARLVAQTAHGGDRLCGRDVLVEQGGQLRAPGQALGRRARDRRRQAEELGRARLDDVVRVQDAHVKEEHGGRRAREELPQPRVVLDARARRRVDEHLSRGVELGPRRAHRAQHPRERRLLRLGPPHVHRRLVADIPHHPQHSCHYTPSSLLRGTHTHSLFTSHSVK